MVTPDTIVKDKGVLFPLAKATEAKTKTVATGLVEAFKNEISGGELSAIQTLIGQASLCPPVTICFTCLLRGGSVS